MKLPDSVYNILKWITMIVLPACATAYVGLAAIWGWPYATEVAKTSAVICTLLGALLGISTAKMRTTTNEILCIFYRSGSLLRAYDLRDQDPQRGPDDLQHDLCVNQCFDLVGV